MKPLTVVARRALVALGLLATTLVVPSLAAPAAAAVPSNIRGSAEGAIRETTPRADGVEHIDTPTMISRITALHENTYDFLIESATDWSDFSTEFMPAAQAAGIQVLAYLVPPSECPSSTANPQSCDLYPPYQKNYVNWGDAIATLSTQYPDLIGWTVDDMDYNLSLFTTSYVASMNSSAHAIAPSLNFFLQLYQPTITSSLISGYGSSIAGVIMPFRDGGYRNTTWTASLQSEITSVTGMLGGKKLIVMLYGNKLSSTQVSPDTDYVTTLVSQALTDAASGQIAGVIIWNLALSATGAPAGSSANMARTGSGALVMTVADNTATTVGEYAQASTTVTLNPGSTSCVMVLHRQDNRDSTAPAGYHEKQAWVGGLKVWHFDVVNDGTDWYSSSPIDITAQLTNGSATLALRLYEIGAVSNYNVTVAFDDIQLTGCSIPNPDFESDSGWTITRSGGPVLASIYRYSSTYTTDTFAAVAALYAA